MDDAHVVRDGERGERLHEDVDDALGRQRVLVAQDAMQAAPVEVLHRDVEQAVGLLAEVDDAHRVRVVQARGGLGLALEAGGEGGVVRVLAVQHLDGDGLLESDLPRAVHGAHGSAADEVLDHELSGDGPADELGGGFRHRSLQCTRLRGVGCKVAARSDT